MNKLTFMDDHLISNDVQSHGPSHVNQEDDDNVVENEHPNDSVSSFTSSVPQ